MLINHHRKQFVSTWHITVHDMVLDKALQRVDTVRQVLKLMSLSFHITRIHRIVDFAGQIIEGTQITITGVNIIFSKFLTIDGVWLYESGKTILFPIGHPPHFSMSV